MEEKDLEKEYKRIFDDIHASETLKRKVLESKPARHNIKPVIAVISSAAAAVAIFAAVRNYDFTPDGDGVISKTTVTTHNDDDLKPTEMPRPQNNEPREPENTAVTDNNSAADAVKEPRRIHEENKNTETGTAVPSVSEQNQYTPVPDKTESVGAQDNSSAASDEQPVSLSADEAVSAPPTEIQKPQIESAISESGSNEPEQTEPVDESKKSGAPAAVYGRRGILLRMNSYSVMPEPAAEYNIDIAEENCEYHAEEWDNNRYFNYIGTDILNKAVLSDDFAYIGGETATFTVNSDGVPLNDTRIFAFTGDNGRYVNIVTSRDTSYTQTCLSAPELEMSDINGTCAVIFQSEYRYSCYMLRGGASIIVNSNGISEPELSELLTALTE